MFGTDFAYTISAMETKTTPRIAYTLGISIPHEMLDNILTTVFGGGINYWCCEARDGHEGDIKRIRSLGGENIKEHCWYADYENKFVYKLWDAETGKPFKVGQKFEAVGNNRESFEVEYKHLTFSTLCEGIRLWMQDSLYNGEDLSCG